MSNGKLGIYTTVYQAIQRDYPFVECIESALYVADEVVVVDGGSDDGTLDVLLDLQKRSNGKLKVYHNVWDSSKRTEMLAIQKSFALSKVESPWAMLLDADEVLHERSKEWIRDAINGCYPSVLGLICNTLHFYKNYETINIGDRFYRNKVYVIRNHIGFLHGRFGDDPDNHITKDGKEVKQYCVKTNIPVFHYGHVKQSKEVYEEKFNRMESMWHKDWKYKEFQWDIGSYEAYTSSHPMWMKERIKKFKEVEL